MEVLKQVERLTRLSNGSQIKFELDQTVSLLQNFVQRLFDFSRLNAGKSRNRLNGPLRENCLCIVSGFPSEAMGANATLRHEVDIKTVVVFLILSLKITERHANH